MSHETMPVITTHSLHPGHKLKLETRKALFMCDGCKELGISSCWTCAESCNFHLHPHCFDPKISLQHKLFPKCSFKWVESGLEDKGKPREQLCDACNLGAKGYFYHCNDCGKDLHPSCANLPQFLSDGELKLELKNKMPTECEKCGWKNQDIYWRYVSTCKTVALHISCMKDLLLENWMKKEGSSQGSAVEDGGNESVRRTPKLEIVIREKEKLAKMKKMVQLVVPIILSAAVGDPVSLTASLIASLFFG
ncbi:unnamed protein product [Spirodela intermedia]|uniref:DC1 domain-containing protein n=1 Tax=Spirodela intermedia TaxID=51605 RepID=A0A7I8IB42_SPIIN|nr:unnamed protein product [Spirodela intermedia]CAA6654956.1 unnamed protein product [Spirodela intermedia]